MSEITRRRVAPDVTRAIALIGVVVMNYHGSMNNVRHPSGFWNHLFHPYTGVLSTRFAATFVVVAGVSVSLMSRSNDIAQRSRLLRRGLVLYAAGLALNHAWGGTIIFYYGAYLMIAAIVVKWSTRRLVALSVAAILISASLSAWLATRGTRTIGWLDPPRIDSLADLVGRTFTGYTHPVFPWIAFFAVGMIIGRHYESFERSARKVVVIAAGMVAIVYVVVHLVRSSGIQNRSALGRFVSTEPFGRGIGYSLTTLGIAVIALAVVSIGTRTETRFTRALQATGQTTLSLYLLHVVVYYVLFEWWSLVEPHGLSTALVVSGIFWIIAVIVATTWREHFGLGPAERVYRAIGG